MRTKDPGVRGILERAVSSVPSQNLKKKCTGGRAGLDTTPFSYGGSSASGARPSTTTSTDLNADVTGEMRAGPAPDATRTSRGSHWWRCRDEESADENSGGHPSSAGSDSRRRITTKREPHEVRDEKTSTTEQHVPRRIPGEDDASRTRSCCHHARGSGWVP